MAIYHLHAATISRGGRSSAKARFDYINRAGKYGHDFAEVMHKEDGNMPEWAMKNPQAYWRAADENERANGRLFKQIEFALPNELAQEEQKNLARAFCLELAQTRDGPLPFSFVVHKGHTDQREPDKQNPHCHLMLSERINDGNNRTLETWFKRAGKSPIRSGARKTQELKVPEWLTQVRALWTQKANAALELAGQEVRIDHRSLKDQGIDREPGIHLGPAAAAMERQGRLTDRGKEYREQELARLVDNDAYIKVKNDSLVKNDDLIYPSMKNDEFVKNKAVFIEKNSISENIQSVTKGEENFTPKEKNTEEMQIGTERMKAQAREWRIAQEQIRKQAMAAEHGQKLEQAGRNKSRGPELGR